MRIRSIVLLGVESRRIQFLKPGNGARFRRSPACETRKPPPLQFLDLPGLDFGFVTVWLLGHEG